MRRLLICVGVAVALVGCAHTKTVKAAPRKPAAKPMVTPDLRPAGRVEMVNMMGRFVVVSFANGGMPALDQRVSVYRGGMKVGEVKITGPQKEINIVAEIVSGEPQTGDEVKVE